MDHASVLRWLTLLLAHVAVELGNARAEIWTDVTGDHQTEAAFVQLEDDAVVLRTKAGREISVPLAKLDERSRQLAKDSAAGSAATAALADETLGDAEPTTLDEFNARLRGDIRPDDNAVVAFWSAIGAIHIHENEDVRQRYLEALGGEVTTPHRPFVSWKAHVEALGGPRPGFGWGSNPLEATDVAAVDAWLAENKKPLDAALLAIERSDYYSPYIAENVGDPSYLAPVVIGRPARDVAYGLAARVRAHLRNRDIDSAAAEALAIQRWAKLLSHDGCLVGQLVSHAIDRFAMKSLGDVMHDRGFNPQLAERVAIQIAKLPPRSTCADALAFDRCMAMEILHGISGGGPKAFTTFIVKFVGMENPEAVAWKDTIRGRIGMFLTSDVWSAEDQKVWREAVSLIGRRFEHYEQTMRAASLGDRLETWRGLVSDLEHPQSGTFSRLFRKADRTTEDQVHQRRLTQGNLPPGTTANEVAMFVHRVTCPDFLPGPRLDADSAVRSALIPTALALSVYHAERGAYPENLGELLPNYLDALPVDPVFASPLVYRTAGDGYRLYYTGPNRRDDGGDYENSDEHDDVGLIAAPSVHG
jgi:hypothetical protein